MFFPKPLSCPRRRRRSRVIAVLLTALLFGSSLTLAGEPDHGPNTQFIRQGDTLILRDIVNGKPADTRFHVGIIPKGTPYYHWKDDRSPVWGWQGYIDSGEVSYWVHDPAGAEQVSGGGIYGSPDPLDASGYGPNGAVFVMPDDIAYVERTSYFITTEAKEKLSRAGIHVVSNGSDALTNWSAFIDAFPLSQVHRLTIRDLYHSRKWAATPPSLRELLNLTSKLPLEPDPWLEKNFPSLQKILLNQPLSEEEADRLAIEVVEVAPSLGTQSGPESDRQRELIRKIVSLPGQDALLDAYFRERSSSYGAYNLLMFKTLDQYRSLKPSPWLATHAPAMEHLLTGEKLSASEHAALAPWIGIIFNQKMMPVGPRLTNPDLRATPLARALRMEFHGEFVQAIRKPTANVGMDDAMPCHASPPASDAP